jgi:hypothetical protein
MYNSKQFKDIPRKDVKEDKLQLNCNSNVNNADG